MALFFRANRKSDDSPVIVNFEAVREVSPCPDGVGALVEKDDGSLLIITADFEQVHRALTPIDFTRLSSDEVRSLGV